MISEDVALSSLRKWVKQREGKRITILNSQKVNDLDGNPASLNVLVTSGDEITADRVKREIQALELKEKTLRPELKIAYQKKDIAEVNRLVADLTKSRSEFVATNGISSYKVSLSKERPPVLSYWPGLPFETAREGAAHDLAVATFGAEASLKELVYYTSQTSLLCFTNGVGQPIYIEPINVTQVELKNLRTANRQRPDDSGRDGRIASQWQDFLKP